jgi:DNA-binding NarL/FixJ family response regulator
MYRIKPLSQQETRVLQFLAQGLNDVEIAEILHIRRRTVCNYVEHAKHKTGIHSRILLAFYAYSKGYVTNYEIKEAIQRERQKRRDEMLRNA